MKGIDMLAHKPWRAEYAKSARSCCGVCNRFIPKGEFRLARIQAANRFEHWNHASCVFRTKHQINSLDEVEGLENLRAEDLENLRKYIHGSLHVVGHNVNKGKSVDPKARPGGYGDISGEYEIETAKSSRSICKSCQHKIEKDHVRVAIMEDNPRYEGKQPAWRHVKCFMELGWWTSPMSKMAGWDNLSVKDQAEVEALERTSPGTGHTLFGSHLGGRKRKASTLRPTKSPTSKSKFSRLSKAAEVVSDAVYGVRRKERSHTVQKRTPMVSTTRRSAAQRKRPVVSTTGRRRTYKARTEL